MLIQSISTFRRCPAADPAQVVHVHRQVGRRRRGGPTARGRGSRRSPCRARRPRARPCRSTGTPPRAPGCAARGCPRRRGAPAGSRPSPAPAAAVPSGPRAWLASPITEISGWPARARSSPTGSRPPRSRSTPVASATRPVKPAACTPAPHTTVGVSMRCSAAVDARSSRRARRSPSRARPGARSRRAPAGSRPPSPTAAR